MSKIKRYARNLLANWVGYGANLVVMFFLSPFVVHSLGDNAYGVWSLLVSLTGYMGLVELGTRGGLGRFITYHLGREDVDHVNGVINTGLTFFIACGFTLILVSGGIAFFFDEVFSKTPVELIGVAKITVMLVALNLWLTFFGTPFFQVLTAFERFDLVNIINLGVLAIRTGLIVWVLQSGGGIVSLAVVQAIATGLGLVAVVSISKRIFPAMRLNFALASRECFRELFTFSMWGFVSNISMQLLYWTDTVVIAALLGPEEVTYFAIGGMLVIYARGILEQCSSIFAPKLIKDIATKNWLELRPFFLHGSMLVMAIGIPLLVGIIVFGRQFITFWMGPVYAERSAEVLVILAFSQMPAIAILLGGSVVLGLNRVRFGAMVTLIQAICNLILSIILITQFDMGIEGVAWGTFYPRLIFTGFIHYCILQWIGISGWDFLKRIVLRWACAIIVFFVICLAISKLGAKPVAGEFFLIQIGLAVVIYLPLSWFGLLNQSQRGQVKLLIKDKWTRMRG